MGTVYSILGAVAGLASFVLWITSIVKAFKGGHTVWGILNLLTGITGLIYFFVKGPKNLGIYWVIAIIVIIVVGALGGGSILQMVPRPA